MDLNEEKTTNQQENNPTFEVTLEAFSGPLDLLCHLVDVRQMDPLKLNLTELVGQYVRFLLKSERTSLNEVAEFFGFASKLLLRKVHSLFPGQQYEETDDAEDLEDEEMTEEELRQLLENFRPYRAAAARLASLQQQRENYFVRIVDEDSTPFYDLGDLYGLASRWWGLLQEYEERHSRADDDEESFYDDIPDAIPDENAVDDRMEELKATLVKGEKIRLRTLYREHSKLSLIVTLLALLEMSRIGMVHIIQNDTLGDVEIVAA